ncbi:BamA/TamA family outer membrane protein [Hymenobacter sp. M29]|uniref:BamA/TamA family outer membrane protein n=1 Tax=Hymenobacter mellowenesis TaxID=3063995 RepID=A0ABT9AFM2_9BACT|nr:BamA/TamA family outer membrane protein [Hymenobacter sp. M29]MDO7847477.1 BamA/TamA family outer membrane protein [Hymenobacter sp. M29]
MKPLLSTYSTKLRPWRRLGPVLGLALLAACSPFKLLRPGQRLLSRVEIKGVEQADKERLTALAQQKPNNRFPLPKVAIYQLGHNFYDSARIKSKLLAIQASYAEKMQAAGTDSAKLGKLIGQRERKVNRKQLALDKGNAIMRLGERPVVYDTALTRHSVEQMTTFLRSQGFFRARVTATDTVRYRRGLLMRGVQAVGSIFPSKPDSLDAVKQRRRVTVTYTIHENKPFLYRLQAPSIPDSGVAAVVRQGQGATLLKENDRYNEDLIGQERTRLETLLKNAGYFDFRQQYITLEADTSYEKFTVRLRTFIANPGPGQGHRVYTVKQVRFITDAGVGRTLRNAAGDTLRRAGTPGALRPRPSLGLRTDTTVTDSIRFAAYEQKFSTSLLARKVLVRPGQHYNLTNTLQTQRLLADLDMFRFNTVNYRKVPDPPAADSSGLHPSTGELVAVINASPAPKFAITDELGGTYVATLPGPFLNFRLKTRNPFGGAEVLELGVRVGFEGQYNRITGSNEYTRQFGATAALVLPQFLVPFRTNHFLTRYNPKTRFSLSDTYVQRPEYTRTNLEFSYDYVWQKSVFHQYVISPVVINLVNTSNKEQSFIDNLNRLAAQGSPLFRSFTQLFEPSMSAASLYNSNDFNETRDARYFRLFGEIGGLSRNLYRNAPWFNLQVYNFAKLTADYRRYHHLTPHTFFVWRLNGGIAQALSTTNVKVEPIDQPAYFEDQLIIPYDKYLFAGGSNSVRAWQPRRLGPGSYTTYRVVDGKPVRDNTSEQPGELLLEGSVEYRFPLYSFINGALFTDFGNVWTIQRDPRPGAQFNFQTFAKQFAVGSGVGIRFDFTFLILRLDIAAKVYDPTAPDTKWAISRFYKDSAYGAAFNIGIGYPF